MNKILAILTVIILLIIAVEVGYYWSIKRSSRVQPVEITQIPKQGDSREPAPQPTLQPTPPNTVPDNTPEEEKKIKALLVQVKSSAKNSAAQAAVDSLGKGAEIKLSQLAIAYQERKMETAAIIPTLPDNPKLTQAMSEYLQNFDTEELATLNPSKWSKPFYMLGLIAYRNNEPSLIVPFWQNTVRLAPEWSFFYAELANYHLSTGKTQEAQDILNKCKQFFAPAFQCNTFLETNVKDNKIESIGFLEETITKELY